MILQKLKTLVLGCLHLFCLLSLLSPFPLSLVASSSRFQLKRGDSISVGKESDFISSPDHTFTCGFHGQGTNAFRFAIWFTNSLDKTVVWTANRDRPVYSKGSKMTLRRDGAMVLTDIDGTIVWQSNTSNTNVAAAELLNTGNLVLKNPQGDILWQSFDSPTDTLLPSMLFTKHTRLTSALRKGGFESGYFNCYFGNDNVLRLISDNPDFSTTYWPNPDFNIYKNGRSNYNRSRIALLDDMGRFTSSDLLQINASDMGYGVKRRLTIDYDGNLRIYSLNNSTGLWDITWRALADPCGVKGVCGRNALCISAVEAKCTCPPGFQVSDPTDWNAGCKAMFNSSLLEESRRVKFLEIPHTDYYGFDMNTTRQVTLENCRDMCLEDVRCLAFNYRLVGEGVCYIKNAMFNGYASPDFPASMYVKYPDSVELSKPDIFHAAKSVCGSSNRDVLVGSPSMYDFSYKKVRWAYVYWFSGVLGVLEFIFVVVGWWFLFKKHGVPASVEAGYRMISSQFRMYTYSELKKATGNFKEELGRGGSGTVYKGVLSDDRIVAVKRLGDAFQSQDEYFAEIRTLGRINHMNLVRILGFCLARRHRLLVYEYVDNSSLDKYLSGSNLLSWQQRFAVALGTAKGLAYLHHECLEWVIHCDVKPENILVDSEFQAKIADFGLAKLLQREGPAGSEFTKIRGTKGYMAPEWTLNHPITAKVDVFGFGVVILEIARGVRVYNWALEDDDNQESALANFVRNTKARMETGGVSWVESLIDPKLEGIFSRNQAATLIQTGIACVEEDRNKRPTMASVVQTLLECEDETQV